MPIDRDKALGQSLGVSESEYKPDDVILYHLGIGAGVPATERGELEYTYEKNLKVLPSFGVVAAFGSLSGILSIPGTAKMFAAPPALTTVGKLGNTFRFFS